MAGVSDVVTGIKKQYGDTAFTFANECVDFERLQFGLFPLDLALGGGIPQGKISMITGPESSSKTTTALKLIANMQKMMSDKKHVWVDAEWGLDPSWASRLGVDVNSLIVGKPEYGEQVVDMMEGLVYADDVGVIVLDSIAGMVPKAELEGDGDRAQVGGNAVIVGRMVRKVVSGLIYQASQGRYPTVLFINQIRKKIGVMFGNPETIPGGHAMLHYCNMIFRTYSKDKILKEVSKTNPARKEVTVTISKWKVPIVAKSARYEIAVVPHNGLDVGDTDDWNTVIAYSKKYGYLAKSGKGWVFAGEEYKTQLEVKEYLEENPDILYELKQKLIQEATAEENRIEGQA